jgi:hypothetical protein
MTRPGFTSRPEVAARRARVLASRTEQIPYAEIAAAESISEGTARMDYARALEQLKAEQDSQAKFNVARQLAALDTAERAAWLVLRKDHIHVQHGKIVRHESGEPVLDDGPVLNAIDRILKISERRARLLGLDAPAKIEVSDATDQAIRDLAAQLAAGVGDVEPAGEGPPAGDPEGSEAGADTA